MMNYQKGFTGAAILAMFLLSLTGCETTGEAAGLGALIGAGLGAAIGGETGALIGAGVGAASGAIAHDVRSTKAEKQASAEATYERYEYREPPPPPPRAPRPPRAHRPPGPPKTIPPPAQPVAGNVSLMFEQSSMTPLSVPGGTMVEATMQYAVMGAGPGREITETRIIKAGQEVVSQVSSQSYTRNDGTWVSRQEFRIPEGWRPGQYTLEQVVQSGDTWVSGTTNFFIQ